MLAGASTLLVTFPVNVVVLPPANNWLLNFDKRSIGGKNARDLLLST